MEVLSTTTNHTASEASEPQMPVVGGRRSPQKSLSTLGATREAAGKQRSHKAGTITADESVKQTPIDGKEAVSVTVADKTTENRNMDGTVATDVEMEEVVTGNGSQLEV